MSFTDRFVIAVITAFLAIGGWVKLSDTERVVTMAAQEIRDTAAAAQIDREVHAKRQNSEISNLKERIAAQRVQGSRLEGKVDILLRSSLPTPK